MRRLTQMLKHPLFSMWLFCVAFVLFNWPSMDISHGLQTLNLPMYIFFVWAAVITVLFIICIVLRAQD